MTDITPITTTSTIPVSTILDGRIARAELKKALIKRIKNLSTLTSPSTPTSTKPTLAIVQVGDRADSNQYIKAKRKFAAEIGVKEIHVKILDTPEKPATQDEVIRVVSRLDADPSVHGIIVQFPLPLSMDKDTVLAAISAKKDVDGLTAANVEKWLEGREDAVWPATVRGIRELLAFYKIPLAGKHVVVVGRSSLVGKPAAAMCLAENATVTICHSKTPHLSEHTRRADILIVAIGKPRFIDASYIREGQVIVDVGISATSTSTSGPTMIAGDVDFDAVKGTVAAITPVPGGVGQMTVLALFENLVDACG